MSQFQSTTGLRLPRSVAVVGASQVLGGSYYGGRLLANMIAAQPKATLYPVNPRYAGQEIEGLAVYAGIGDLPEVPDMVVITTAVKAVLPVLEEAAALGVQTCVVISAESGDAQAKRSFDAQVASVAQRTGMRIIGPNSMGVLNGNAGLNCSFTSATTGVGLNAGNVAMLAQSGAAIAYLLQVFRGTCMGYSWLVSTGNEAGTSLEQIFDDLLADRHTDVIMLFVEGVADGARFRRAALRARIAGKAVLMLNSGVSESGRDAVQSHTGRMAGAAEMIAAVVKESGMVHAVSYQDFFDSAKALVDQGVARRSQPHGRRAVIITTSGGAGTVMADQLSALGWSLPDLPASVVAKLEIIAKAREIGNPIDVTGAFADNTMLPQLIHTVASCTDMDAIFVVTGAGGGLATGVAAKIVEATGDLQQEIYVAWVGLTPEVAQTFDGSRVSAYADPLRAARSAEACAAFRQGQQALAGITATLDLLENITPGQARSSVCGPGLATAAQMLTLVQAAGVPCAPFAIVDSIDGDKAAAAADSVGYPVVLKIDSTGLNHKSDLGGVRLHLGNAGSVKDTALEFMKIAKAEHLDGASILVQAMTRGIELFVGIKHDDAFGPLLLLGLGGTHAELHADSVTTVVLPATRNAIEDMLDRNVKLGHLLAGYRGQPGGGRKALLDTVEAIARWAVAQGTMLREADFNPIMVTATSAVVVDARGVWSVAS